MQIFITDWWLCPELYLRRPFHNHGSSRLDSLLEAKAKQGVQVFFAQSKKIYGYLVPFSALIHLMFLTPKFTWYLYMESTTILFLVFSADRD